MTASVVAPVEDLPTPSATTREPRHPAVVVAVLAATAGLVLRLWPRGPLWLDEAQSVAFARLPLTSIPHALREDGAPPLYYLVLHVWMRVFGGSDVAVRSLSIVASVAFIVVITRYALRAGGTVAAASTAVVAATTPYAVRYGTEARMYALVALEVALGLWVLDAALTRPTPRRLVAVAAVSAALLYTHYWSLYLLASVGVVLLLDVWRRGRSSQSARSPARAAAAIVAGGVLWLPWVPTFRYQAAHTGTPWARSTLGSMLRITSGASDGGLLPALFILLGVVLAFHVHRLPARTSIAPPAVAAVLILCPALAAVGALSSGSAYVSRYASVVFPLAVLLAGLALSRIASRRALVALLCLFAVGCGALAAREASTPRTRAGVLADVLEQRVRSGDVVVYCPDQLGPAMSRVLDQRGIDVAQVVFPDGSPQRVQWIDYESRYSRSRPLRFARDTVTAAGEHAVWLVSSETYPPTQPSCTALRRILDRIRRVDVAIADDGSFADHGGLRRYVAADADG
jgi:4-amino-4-deoxy-L-arabinose transferase-like glycosyltransferase